MRCTGFRNWEDKRKRQGEGYPRHNTAQHRSGWTGYRSVNPNWTQMKPNHNATFTSFTYSWSIWDMVAAAGEKSDVVFGGTFLKSLSTNMESPSILQNISHTTLYSWRKPWSVTRRNSSFCACCVFCCLLVVGT